MAAPPPPPTPPNRASTPPPASPPPSRSDDDAAEAAAPPPPSTTPDGGTSDPDQSLVPMPEILSRQVNDIETWAVSNNRDASRESLRFWALKVPAIVGAATAGVTGFLGWEIVCLVIGGLASACVLIDSLNPAAKLRNAHLAAVHDLRQLEQDMTETWNVNAWRLTTREERLELASKIIQDAQPELDRIGNALELAETRLNQESSPPAPTG